LIDRFLILLYDVISYVEINIICGEMILTQSSMISTYYPDIYLV